MIKYFAQLHFHKSMKLTPFATAALYSAASAIKVADDYGIFDFEPTSMVNDVEAFFAEDDIPYVSSSSRYYQRPSYYEESSDDYEPILYRKNYKTVDYGFTTHYYSSESEYDSHFHYKPNAKTHVVSKILNGYSESNDVSYELPNHHYTDSADEAFLEAMERIAGSESTPEELYYHYFSSAEDTSHSLTQISDSSDAGYHKHRQYSDHYSDHHHYYSDDHYTVDSYGYGDRYNYNDGYYSEDYYSEDYYPYSEDSYYHYTEDSYYPYSEDSYYYKDDYYSDGDSYYSDDSYYYDDDSYYYHNNRYDGQVYEDSEDSYYYASEDDYQGYYRFPGDPESHSPHYESSHYVEDHYVEEPAPKFKYYDEFNEAQKQP